MSEDSSVNARAAGEPANDVTPRPHGKGGLWIGLAFVAALVLLVALNMR
jgi:hypothetical protein